MSLAQNLPPWRVKMEQDALKKGEQLGLQLGEQLGLQKGEQLGLQKGERLGLQRGEQLGLRTAVQLVVEARFGSLGARFWRDHLDMLTVAPWLDILSVASHARSLDELHRFRA